MFKILKHLRVREWALIVASLVFIMLQVWLDLKLPEYMAKITMLLQTEGSSMIEIWTAGGYMLLFTLISSFAAIILGFFAADVGAAFSMQLRSKLFAKTLSFSMEEMNSFSTASLITRSTNDITQVQMIIAMGLQAIVRAPILAVWAILKIYGKSWQWTATTGVAILILLVMLSVIIVFAIPKFRIVQRLTDNLNGVTRENLTGLRVIRAYNAESYQEQKFSQANTELTNTNLFAMRVMAIMQPGMSFIMSGLGLAIYWLGAHLINTSTNIMDKRVFFADMVVFSAYAMQVIMAFMMLSMIFVMLPRASVSAKRINEVLDTKPAIIDGHISVTDNNRHGDIEFRNVSFKYPGAEEYVLKDISFSVHTGETAAFIGSTGSGKSTLINLIPRFYDATEGEVLLDGINVKDYTLEALHAKLGYVPQQAVIFSGTISSNVAYGERTAATANEEAVRKAIELAQGTEFVEKMDQKYNAVIAQGGTNISGGQKQRLAIARAIYRKPEILIFDDSFSALDYQTDRQLRSVLTAETSGQTRLIVAQRIGTIIDADKIIVLEDGKIVGLGTHDELLETCIEYQETAFSQFSREELNYG